jgi:NADH-quinone oxidoreductase subunit H
MDWTVLTVSTLAKILFAVAIILGVAPVLLWAERRQSAMMQDRIGPNRAGFTIPSWLPWPFPRRKVALAGLLHPLADAVKMIWKEDFVPPKADKFLHSVAPIIAVMPVILTFAVVPFAEPLYLEAAGEVIRDLGSGRRCIVDTGAVGAPCAASLVDGPIIPMQIASLNVGVLFIFAVAGTGIIGAAVAGYASDNKYSLLGGMRAAGQMVSYEVTLGLTLVGCFMIYETVLLEDMVAWQRAHYWGVLVQPFAFIFFFAASIAETKRIPFDLPEAESELVAGYFTEYSGMKFGMFFMAEFIEIIVLSAVMSAIFFGGFSLPFLTSSGFEAFGYLFPIPHWGILTIQVLAFLLKVLLLIFLQLQIRWSLPRFRYDQTMNLCWKYLLPLSLVNILVTGAVILALDA